MTEQTEVAPRVPALARIAPEARAGSSSEVEPGARALAVVYREQHDYVWRSLVRLGVPYDQVADSVHDVFLVVARRLPEFEGRASIRTWIFSIAMRVAQAARRDLARARKRAARMEPGSEGHSPHEAMDASAALYSLLDRIDDEKRAVFVMAELEGMTAPEIAEVLGVKRSTVYSRLRLAREALEKVAERVRATEQRRAR